MISLVNFILSKQFFPSTDSLSQKKCIERLFDHFLMYKDRTLDDVFFSVLFLNMSHSNITFPF